MNKYIEKTFHWTFDASVNQFLLNDLSVEVGGGQLKNEGMCLGYTTKQNYPPLEAGQEAPAEDDEDYETRIQLVKCLTPEDIPNFESEDAFIAKLKEQLWTADSVDTTDYKVILRNVCTDLVIKKITDCDSESHATKVYSGQKYCPTKHFDLALVEKSECVDGDLYNVNHCLFDYEKVEN